MTSDLLTLTDTALISISKKIIDYRKYSENLISTVGEVNITDSKANNFDDKSYLSKSNLILPSDNLGITFEGLFVPSSDRTQTAWKLFGASNVLSLQLINNIITLSLNSEVVFSFSTITFTGNSTLKVITSLTPSSCEITVLVNDEITENFVNFNEPIDLSSFSHLIIGNDNANLETYWLGSINLQQFTLTNNLSIVYAPATSESLSFSKIVVSDGSMPMPITPMSRVNHMYALDIQEISRSGNTLLLTSEVGTESKLIIKEVGIYAIKDGEEFLFSSVDNLNINKGKKLSYDLILTLNIATSFLNMIGFPNIVLNVPERTKLKNFKTVSDVLIYVFTSLERLIALNATNIGYNRAQIFYRMQQEMLQTENCYSAIQVFSKLVNKLSRSYEDQINYGTISLEGEIEVPINGKTSGFSTNNYVIGYPDFLVNGDSNIKASFTTNDDTTTKQYVMSSGTVTANQPLSLYIENSKCHLSLNTQEVIETIMIPGKRQKYYRDDMHAGTTLFESDTPYYGWVLSNYTSTENANVNLYNFHTSYPVGIQSTSNISIPTASSEILWNIESEIDTSSWEFFMNFSTYTMDSLQYIMGDGSSKQSPIKLYIDANNILNLEFPEIGISLSTSTPLQPIQKYSISISYNDSKYSLNCEAENGSTEYMEQESTNLIILDTTKSIAFGSNNDTDKFTGKIDFSSCSFQTMDFAWYAAASLYAIFTTEMTPTVNSDLYDLNGVLIPNIKPAAISCNSIIDSDIFNVLPNNTYYVNITYVADGINSYYKIEYSRNNNPYIESSTISSTDILGNINSLYIGVCPLYSQGDMEPTILNPFLGTLNLLDFLLKCPSDTWTPANRVLISKDQTSQYYHLQKFNRESYFIHDIGDYNYELEIYEDTFKGNKDKINFYNNYGFTLCTKVDLKDSEPKLLIAKSDLNDNLYFAITYINNNITFILNTDEGYSSVTKSLATTEIYDYEHNPFLLTVRITNRNGNYNITMNKNNEIIATSEGYSSSFGNPANTFLTNYLPNHMLSIICADEVNETWTLDKLIERVQEKTSIYVSDIITIEGAISDNNLYYITNLTDTNF